MSEITLTNLGGGAAVEKFQEEFEKVVQNISDPNTDAKAKREVILKVTIQPDSERRLAGMKIEALAKLAPSVAYATRAFIGVDRESGKVSAFEDDPNQMTIEDFVDRDKNVEHIEPTADKAEGGTP
ncbi:MAG: hypothetical protein ACYTEX_11255 [Planctomycetota bacterium]|jgi:hypothetical protein